MFAPSVRKSAERIMAFSSLSQKIRQDRKLILSYLPWMRFERMTYRLEGGCSIQLSYQGLKYLLFNCHSQLYRATGGCGFLILCWLSPTGQLSYQGLKYLLFNCHSQLYRATGGCGFLILCWLSPTGQLSYQGLCYS